MATSTLQETLVSVPEPPKDNRMPDLDGVRGLAVLLVMSLHAFSYSMEREKWSGFPSLVEHITRPMWSGVDLFFVLSGFLITGILLDSARKPHYFRNFYGRRALRILPLCYLLLVIILFVYPHSGSFVLLGFLYLSNMTALFGVPDIYGPLWSLAVEEHFYLLWPSVVRVLDRKKVALVAYGIILVEPIVRLVGAAHGWDVGPYSWFRFDGMAFGAVLATLVRSDGYTPRRLFRFALGCLAAAALLGVLGAPLGIYNRQRLFGLSLQYTLINLVFAGFIGVIRSGGIPALTSLMCFRPLRWCGDLSYCLYLFHVLCLDTWDRLFGRHPLLLEASVGRFGSICVRAAVSYTCCFVIAELSQRYFEGPILKLKRYFS